MSERSGCHETACRCPSFCNRQQLARFSSIAVRVPKPQNAGNAPGYRRFGPRPAPPCALGILNGQAHDLRLWNGESHNTSPVIGADIIEYCPFWTGANPLRANVVSIRVLCERTRRLYRSLASCILMCAMLARVIEYGICSTRFSGFYVNWILVSRCTHNESCAQIMSQYDTQRCRLGFIFRLKHGPSEAIKRG